MKPSNVYWNHFNISSPSQSQSQAVVCVSTPRMYLRSGYFLVIIKIWNIFFQGDLHMIKHSVILDGIPLMKENLHILDTPLTTYLPHLVDIFFGWHFKGFFDLNDCLWSYIENSKSWVILVSPPFQSLSIDQEKIFVHCQVNFEKKFLLFNYSGALEGVKYWGC